MKTLNLFTALFLSAAICFPEISYPDPIDRAVKAKIKVALILDTSNSMDGLIDQARAQLWQTVNDLSTAKFNDQSVDIEIALYEYGNDDLSKRDGFIRKVSGLSQDLDKISEDLFNLSTNGGDEYSGLAINRAVDELEWGDSNDDLKLIFIAGNESFSQGPFSYEKACKNAISEGIIVNTIHCGHEITGINDYWEHAAELADGTFVNIDQNQQTVYVPTPFDDDITKLNEELNDTYLAYGSSGKDRKLRQENQDKNAGNMAAEVLVYRSISKASPSVYTNHDWDLIDASDRDDFDISKVPAETLPAEMQALKSDEDKLAFINEKKKKRTEIQAKIQDLSLKRAEFITERNHEINKSAGLNEAMLKAVIEKASEKNYVFE